MPEGDTLHTLARVLAPLLVDQPLEVLTLRQRPEPLAPHAHVRAVEALGKHLLLTLANGERAPVLRVHLGMSGVWHRYRPGEPWPFPEGLASVVLRTARWVVVCFRAPQVAFYPDRAHALADDALARLGPDLLAPSFELDAVVARAHARAADAPDLAIADLLLDQRVAAGIGNAYKSELLFLAALDPFTPAHAVPLPALAALYARARALLQENVAHGGWRTTTQTSEPSQGMGSQAQEPVAIPSSSPSLPHPAPQHPPQLPRDHRHWVYRRAGRPCHRCLTPIRVANQGPHGRRTFWCPRCQAARPL